MNLDPVDVFGETLAQPFKRSLLFALALFTGGWVGEISMNVNFGDWKVFGWNEFSDGFLWPIAMLFSSAGILLVPGFLVFVMSSWRLDWMWFLAAAGTSAFVLVDGEADSGWFAWTVLNTGLAGMVWLNAAWQKARWSQDMAELSAHNSLQRALRESESSEKDEEPETTVDESPENETPAKGSATP
jgi:hypothetical protein